MTLKRMTFPQDCAFCFLPLRLASTVLYSDVQSSSLAMQNQFLHIISVKKVTGSIDATTIELITSHIVGVLLSFGNVVQQQQEQKLQLLVTSFQRKSSSPRR